jgi:putative copper export protein
MIGVIIFLIFLLVVIPVGFLMTMALPAGIVGFLLKSKAEKDHAGSELLDTNY